jgi:hypothetical protein
MKRLIGLAVCAALGGCGGQAKPQTHVVYQTVDRPVPVACVPSGLRPPPENLLTKEEVAKLDGPQRYVAITADWLQRVARMNDTEPVIAGCSKVPTR